MKRLLMVLLMLPFLLATTYNDLSLSQMIERADLAFFGKVTVVRTEERFGDPWTVVTFDITTALTSLEQKQVDLAFFGGSLPSGRTLTVNLMPNFSPGEEVLIFAYDSDFYSPLVGFRQGLWRLQNDLFLDEEGRRLSLDDKGELVRDGLGADPASLLDALSRAFGGRK